MQFRIHSLFILLLSAVILISACKGVDDISFTGIDNVVLKGIDNNKVNFSADVGMYNPSSVTFKVREVNLKTIVDGNFIGVLSIDNPIKIHARSDTAYNADFSLQMANMLTGASALYGLSRKKQVTVEMKGYVKARSWLAFRKVEINEKQIVDVPSFNR